MKSMSIRYLNAVPADIVLKTGHTQGAVDRYIKANEQVLKLVNKRHTAISICQITGRTMNTNRQYLRLVKDFYPELKVYVPEKIPSVKMKQNIKHYNIVTGQMS